MQKKIITTYFLIFAAILVMMSLSHPATEKLRGRFVAVLTPLWEKILVFKHFLRHPAQPSPFSSLSLKEELQRLQLDNQLLTTELAILQQLYNEQAHLSSQLERLVASSPSDVRLTAPDEKALQMALKRMQWRLNSIPARVIFRSFDSWNSSLWINVGETTNQMHQAALIAKNSPVVLGNAIVGVIDYVGKAQSRVCLITDSRLTPAVRASRGGEQDLLASGYVEGLLQQLHRKKQLPISTDDSKRLFQILQQLKQNLQPLKKSWYLAKGELLGSPSNSRRYQEVHLKGSGFNYDFADEDGEACDLRTGKSLQGPYESTIPILKVHDLLVTTGMDGLFPSGFQVATVTKIGLLKEGDYFYDLEAESVAGPLEELSLVFVLPPVIEEQHEERELNR